MAGKVPPEQVKDSESDAIGMFEEAVARAEKLGQMARQAAEASTRTSQDALDRAEKISG